MANTYVLISSQVLASSAASVTFSSIPATYTDLCLKVSTRGTIASYNGVCALTFNGDTATDYSSTYVRGLSTVAQSGNFSTYASTYWDYFSGSTTTANTFGSLEFYIPNYTSSAKKPLSGFSTAENNDATSWIISPTASLWQLTSAITSITATPASGSFVQYSSFYLYGISNA